MYSYSASKLMIADALPRISGTAMTIRRPATADEEIIGKSLVFFAKNESMVCLTKALPRLLI
jgi:hypothetical protein